MRLLGQQQQQQMLGQQRQQQSVDPAANMGNTLTYLIAALTYLIINIGLYYTVMPIWVIH